MDNGTTWTSLGDGSFGTLAIGSIAVDPQNTNTVWVGTGEANGALDNYGGEGVWTYFPHIEVALSVEFIF